MKTPEQIKAWLEAQPWYEQFKNNTLNGFVNFDVNVNQSSAETLLGKRGESTIMLAFYWEATDEGAGFWNEVDFQFREWYHNEENPD